MSHAAADSGPARHAQLPRQPLRRFSAVDALVQLLRNGILDGALAPGVTITELEIVETYGVSRPTAKAALRALTAERILRQDPNRSAVVAAPSADDVRDLFRLRIPIELEIVREIVTSQAVEHPGFQVSSEAYEAVEDMWRLVERDVQPHEFVAADLRFHKALAQSAGSERLLRCFAELEGELHLSMLQSYTYLDRSAIATQHGDILARIETAIADGQGDWRPAKRAMKDHLRSACRLIGEGIAARDVTLRAAGS